MLRAMWTTSTPGRRCALLGASAAVVVCVGAGLASCGGGGEGGEGFVATGPGGGPSGNPGPTGAVRLVPLPSGTPGVCPGLSPTCRTHCYAVAVERYRPAAAARYRRNLRDSRRRGQAGADESHRTDAPAAR